MRERRGMTYDRSFDEDTGYGEEQRGNRGEFPGNRRDRDAGYGDYPRGQGRFGEGGLERSFGRQSGQEQGRYGEGQRFGSSEEYGGWQQGERGMFGQGQHGQREYGQRDYGRDDYGSREFGRERGFGGGQYGGQGGQYGGQGGQYGGGFGGGQFGGGQSGERGQFGNERGQFGHGSGPFAGKGPRGFKRGDDRIYDELGDRFTRDPWLDASDLQFDVREGTVTLRGTVDEREAKRRAEDIAESISGVTDVKNEIKVQQKSGQDWRTSAMTGGAAGAATRGDPFGRSGDTRNKRTIAGVFRDMSMADRAINELKSMGFTREDISFVTRDRGMTSQGGTTQGGTTGAETKGATTGAVLGGLGGGALGWLLGIGALAIPGAGPVVAAGAIATTIAGAATGAVAGGLVGALVGVGIPENEAKQYEDLIKQGGVLVTVSCHNEQECDRAKDVLKRLEADKVHEFHGDRREPAGTPTNGTKREPATR